jgi:hypothetical protein
VTPPPSEEGRSRDHFAAYCKSAAILLQRPLVRATERLQFLQDNDRIHDESVVLLDEEDFGIPESGADRFSQQSSFNGIFHILQKGFELFFHF